MNEGRYVQITCLVSEGDLPVNIQWLFNGKSVRTVPEITSGNLGKRSSFLTIESVLYSNAGNYTCLAENAAGLVHYTIELHVNG